MLAPLALAAALLRAAPGWELDGEPSGGLQVERRGVEGLAFDELRVTATAPSSPEALSLAAFELRDRGVQVRYLEQRSVISEAPGQRLVYLRVRAPFIGARECVMQQSRVVNREAGTARVAYQALEVAADTPHRQFTALRGDWRFGPHPGGGTRVVLVLLSDVGGVPRWLARLAEGEQREAAVAAVREIIERAPALEAAAHPKGDAGRP